MKIQSKLTINTPDDPYEHEADLVAEQVMQMSETIIFRAIQVTQAFKTNTKSSEINKSISNSVMNSKGNGVPLTRNIQDFMKSRFRTDFSKVKIHTDSHSESLNQEIGAKAFTIGEDIYFNQGQFNPNSREGKKLLAHELTHTVQQKRGKTGSDQQEIQREGELRQNRVSREQI